MILKRNYQTIEIHWKVNYMHILFLYFHLYFYFFSWHRISSFNMTVWVILYLQMWFFDAWFSNCYNTVYHISRSPFLYLNFCAKQTIYGWILNIFFFHFHWIGSPTRVTLCLTFRIYRCLKVFLLWLVFIEYKLKKNKTKKNP